MRNMWFLVCLMCTIPAYAQQPGPHDVYVRVVDVGPGLCTITKIPGDHYMVYDAGHWFGGRCIAAVQELIEGETIDLLILSHSDADHLGDADEILDHYRVRQIIRTGLVRDSGTWKSMNERIGQHAETGGSILNLQSVDLIPGTTIQLGDATVTLVTGWKKWTDPGPTSAERRNAISIVVQLTYHGQRILFTGDTIGRRLDDPDTACKDAEKRMVDHAAEVSIQSDIIIAPHHGGNNGSSSCFIQAVDPTFVIFSAGHDHEHPTEGTAGRYLAHGVSVSNIFRTDRGDDEGGFEWDEGRIPGCKDKRGDDDVEIILPANGAPTVKYRLAAAGC